MTWTGEERRENHAREDLRTAFAGAIRDVLSDKELTARFWEQGYQQLQEHAISNGSQWVGKRLVTTLIMAVVTAGIIWLAKNGALK